MLNTLKVHGDFLSYSLDTLAKDLPVKTVLDNNTRVEIIASGVIIFEPEDYSETDIILSSGIHGNETAPIELCNGLIKNILHQTLVLKARVMFVFGNLPAITNDCRFIDENLNRLFALQPQIGKPENAEQHRAEELKKCVEYFFETALTSCEKPATVRHRIHYDLHTAIRDSKHEKFAIYPFMQGRDYSREQVLFLQHAGVDTILLQHEPSPTFSYFSANKYQADGFTVELGKVYAMGQNDMSRFAQFEQGVIQILTQGTLPKVKLGLKQSTLYRVVRVIIKTAPDFAFTFADDTENFTIFKQGDVLATEAGNKIVVKENIEAIVFPNANVAIGQRAALCLIPTDKLVR